jgi:hypothetical protein
MSAKLPFNHPLVVTFNAANLEYKAACRMWYKVRCAVGSLRDAEPKMRFLYYEEKQKYTDACKAYTAARTLFQSEVAKIYAKAPKTDETADLSYDISTMLVGITPLKGDGKLQEALLKNDQEIYKSYNDPETLAMMELMRKKKETGESLLVTDKDVAELAKVSAARISEELSASLRTEEAPFLEGGEDL